MDMIREGENHYLEGNLAEARVCFLNALRNDPDNKEVYNNLGVTCFQDRQHDRAVDYFEKALSIDPFYRDGVMNFCALLKRMGCE